MTQTVSISDARANLADYIALSRQGHRVIIRDEKKNEDIAELITHLTYNPDAYKRALEYIAAHPITAKDHPEWATPAKVNKWLRQTRASWNRRFD